MSIQAISELTGWERKTFASRCRCRGGVGLCPTQPRKLDALQPYFEEWLRAGVWNARVLLREMPESNITELHDSDGLVSGRNAVRHEWWQ
jgi:hypothetical protein